VASVQRTSGVDQPVATGNPAVLWLGSAMLCLLLALALGITLPKVMSLPTSGALLMCLVICGGLVGVMWLVVRRPVVPILLVALISSTATRAEFNLIKLPQEAEMSGLMITLTLLLAALLTVHHIVTKMLLSDRREPVFPWSFSLPLAALFGWCAFSAADSRYPNCSGAGLWLLLANILLCFAITAYCSDEDGLRTAVMAAVLTVGLTGVLCLLQYGFEIGNNWTFLGARPDEETSTFADGEVRRIPGFLRTPTGLGWYLGTWLPVLLALLATRSNGLRRWQWWGCLGATIFGIVALILTYARGSWAAFAGGLLFLLPSLYFLLPLAERPRYKRGVTVGLLFLGLLCLPFTPLLLTRLTEDDRGSASSRLPSMEVAAAVIADNPLLGIGLNSYRIEASRYDDTPRMVSDELIAVHNMYLHMAAEGGVPAALLFLLLLAQVLWRGWLTVRYSEDVFLRTLALGLLNGLVAFLWTGLKEPGSFGSPQLRVCFLFFGLLLAIDRIRRRTETAFADGW
jgi:putative inorganic carbon (hco3(-)) transporter